MKQLKMEIIGGRYDGMKLMVNQAKITPSIVFDTAFLEDLLGTGNGQREGLPAQSRFTHIDGKLFPQ